MFLIPSTPHDLSRPTRLTKVSLGAPADIPVDRACLVLLCYVAAVSYYFAPARDRGPLRFSQKRPADPGLTQGGQVPPTGQPRPQWKMELSACYCIMWCMLSIVLVSVGW